MSNSLPQILKDLLGLDITIVPVEVEKKNLCDYCAQITKEAVQALHTRPLYVIASTPFNSLEDANEQLSEWFVDGTLDGVAAVYRVSDDIATFYVISSTEFDTLEEANEQLIEWHNEGLLHKKARVYQSDLANTYEIKLELVKASLL